MSFERPNIRFLAKISCVTRLLMVTSLTKPDKISSSFEQEIGSAFEHTHPANFRFEQG